jgi:hypothetical protein
MCNLRNVRLTVLHLPFLLMMAHEYCWLYQVMQKKSPEPSTIQAQAGTLVRPSECLFYSRSESEMFDIMLLKKYSSCAQRNTVLACLRPRGRECRATDVAFSP